MMWQTLLWIALATTSSEPPAAVVVVLVGPQADDPALRALPAVEGQISDLPILLEFEPVARMTGGPAMQTAVVRAAAQKHRAIAVLWAERTRQHEVFLHVADPTGERILSRGIRADGHAGYEALGIIGRGFLRALVEGGTIGVRVAPVVAQPPSVVPPDLGVGIVAAVQTSWTGDSVVAAMDMGLALALTRRWSVLASYGFAYPWRAKAGALVLDLQSHPTSVGVRYSGSSDGFGLGFSLPVTLDYLVRRAHSRSSAVIPTGTKAWWLASFSPTVRGRVGLGTHMDLYVDLGVEILVNQVEFAISTAEGNKVAYTPWRVRPRGVVGLEVPLF